MKAFKPMYTILTLSMLFGCVPQGDYDKLLAENELLKSQVEEYKYGAERLIAEVENAYAEKEYNQARNAISMLSQKHPHSSKNKEFEELLAVMDSEEKAEIAQREAVIAQREEVEKEKLAQREAAEKEKARLANLNNTGMWQVSYFVDDFGEPTKDGYITNKQFIKGLFSNTATEDSKLNVRLLTLSETNIHIMLYEYAGNNPVKASSRVTYTLLVQDKDGNRLELKAGHRSDRLILQVEASSGVHQALMKGGEVRFRIIENGNRTNQYSFDISDADRYDNAYRIMSER